MSKAFDSIREGFEDAIAYAKGDAARGRASDIPVEECDVAAVRARLGMTQKAFADNLAVSVYTLRKWEQRKRVPSGPARTLLKVMEREPEAVRRALG